MRDYIILNGVNSNTITGLLISKLPPITKPKIRTQTEEIDGRDGDIVTKLGYSAYDKELEIGLYGDFDIDDVIAYFNSEGTVTFSNEPDKFYNYQILDQIDYEKLIRFKKAKVKMHVQPFKYPLEETPVEITNQYVNDEAEEIDLDNTKEAPMKIDLKGNVGKNLFNPNVEINSTYTSSIATALNNFKTTGKYAKGYISSQDTIQSSDEFISAFINCESGVTYTINNTYSVAANLTSVIFLDNNGNIISRNTAWSNNAYTHTATSEEKYIMVGIKINDNGVDYRNWVMLNEGSTALPYEPYGASVTGDNSIEVVGKNLLENIATTQTTNGITFTINEDKTIIANGTASANIYFILGNITLKPSTPYFLSGCPANDGSNAYRLYAYMYDSNNTYLNVALDYGNGTTINNASLDHIQVGIAISNGKTINNLKFYPMVEKNSQATEYQEYKGASYPISLGDIELNTGDSIQFLTDNWYIVRANEMQEEITDATLISQLQASKNASSYDTKTHISQTNDSKPFILNATAIQKGSGEATVNNEGNIYSKPTLDIEGSGTVGIYLDGNQIFSIDLSNSSECVIDTTQLEAYNPTTSELMNRQVTGDYSNFKLNAGDNQVQATGEITKVTISNYTRWL